MKKKPIFLFRSVLFLCLIGLFACQEWDKTDPEAGNQVYPKLVQKGDYEFGKEFPEDAFLGTYENGESPAIVIDEAFGYVSMLNGGYIQYDNPLLDASLQKGFSLTMWVNATSSNSDDAAIFSFTNDKDTTLYFTPNGSLTYKAGDVTSQAVSTNDLLIKDTWNYLALIVDTGGYTVYVNGVEQISQRGGDINYMDVVASVPSLTSFYLGYGSETAPGTLYIDNIGVYRNIITDRYIATPEIENDATNALPVPVYSNDFENGIMSETIVGTGKVVDDANSVFGKVFHNVGPDGVQAQRTNYLKLPLDIFTKITDGGTNEMTISFWVNVGTASGYYWSPIFSAYGAAPIDNANTWPMMVLQSRLVAQVNCNGWCDFPDDFNDNGANEVGTAWIDDGNWHLYTCVWTETKVQIYIDGVVRNSWSVDGVSGGQVVSGPIKSGSELSYICLGGNQAWSWGDIDPAYMFDDVAIYPKALTESQIELIMELKNSTIPSATNE